MCSVELKLPKDECNKSPANPNSKSRKLISCLGGRLVEQLAVSAMSKLRLAKASTNKIKTSTGLDDSSSGISSCTSSQSGSSKKIHLPERDLHGALGTSVVVEAIDQREMSSLSSVSCLNFDLDSDLEASWKGDSNPISKLLIDPNQAQEYNIDKSSNDSEMRRTYYASGLDSSSNHAVYRKRRRRESSTDTKIEDDVEGHLIFKPGDVLKRRYKVEQIVGQGTFAQVANVTDLRAFDDRGKEQPKANCLALKVIKNITKYREAAKFEINILNHIMSPYHGDSRYSSAGYHQKSGNRYYTSELNEVTEAGRRLCVQMLDWFDYHGHICILFEMLGRSIFDFLKLNRFQPYPFEHVRSIGHQLTLAVNFLHKNKITHTDLKPENILFVNDAYNVEYPDRLSNKVEQYIVVKDPTIRLIDFGSATFDHEHHSKVVSTRHYRAIEVILELGWSHPCDVWSIGCILFELYTGLTMFQIHDNRQHLAMMQRILGRIPRQLGLSTQTKYFDRQGWLIWNDDSPADHFIRRNCQPLRNYMSNTSRDELDLFDLIEQMLNYDPYDRITCSRALRHPFLDMRGKTASA